MGRQASTVAIGIKIRANIYFDETAMTIANVDDFGRNVRSAIRHHWVLFLIPGFMSGLALVMTAIACRSVNDASEKAAPVGRTT